MNGPFFSRTHGVNRRLVAFCLGRTNSLPPSADRISMSTTLLDEILKGEEVLATGRRAPCLRAPHSVASSHARLLRSLVTGRSLPQALPCTLLHEGRHLAMLDPTARQPELPVRAHRPR